LKSEHTELESESNTREKTRARQKNDGVRYQATFSFSLLEQPSSAVAFASEDEKEKK
jgi:hypothetical protein